jgi:predicted nucleotidyltransferase
VGVGIDIQAASRAWLRRQADRQARIEQRWRTAQRDVARILAMIVERYRPLRVYQWGSLLDRSRFSEISDVDLAVEGVTDPRAFFALLEEADRLTGLPVDIVQLETIHPLHAESIRKKGRLVHERLG